MQINFIQLIWGTSNFKKAHSFSYSVPGGHTRLFPDGSLNHGHAFFKGTRKYANGQFLIIQLYSRSQIWEMGIVKYFFPRTMATRIEDYYKEDEDSYKRILKMGKTKTVEKTRKMKKVKTRKRDNFKYSDENDDVDHNDNVCEDIGKVREMMIGEEDEENED